MLTYIFIFACVFAAWIAWEIHRAPTIEDERTTLTDDPTTSCWDNDHHPDQPV